MRRPASVVAGVALMALTSGCATVGGFGGGGSDGEVAQVFMTANAGEVQTGQLATNEAQNASVRQFAQRMVAEHAATNQRTEAVLDDRNLAPVPTDASRALQQNTQATVEALRTYDGAAFDRAYMQSQVAMHEYTLNTLDDVLIPAAGNRDLEQLLVARDRKSVV